MKFIISAATKIKYKTDGVRVWWWSSNIGVWFPDFNITPEVLNNIVDTGNGYIVN